VSTCVRITRKVKPPTNTIAQSHNRELDMQHIQTRHEVLTNIDVVSNDRSDRTSENERRGPSHNCRGGLRCSQRRREVRHSPVSSRHGEERDELPGTDTNTWLQERSGKAVQENAARFSVQCIRKGATPSRGAGKITEKIILSTDLRIPAVTKHDAERVCA
jgi:hypothetical protein